MPFIHSKVKALFSSAGDNLWTKFKKKKGKTFGVGPAREENLLKCRMNQILSAKRNGTKVCILGGG